MENKYSMILTTCADGESARKIARLLVKRRLAACVHLFPVESVYVWQGEVCEDRETLLLIKSGNGLFEEIAGAIRENHTYEIPEVIEVPITDGLPEYLRWLGESVAGCEE